DSGLIWGVSIGPPGGGPATLLEALLAPGPPPFPPRRALPGRLVLADAALAPPLRAALPDPRVEVTVSPPPPEPAALFAQLFAQLERQQRPTLALPDDASAPLCAACVQLWRAKPWQFADDEPPIEIRPRPPGAPGPPNATAPAAPARVALAAP